MSRRRISYIHPYRSIGLESLDRETTIRARLTVFPGIQFHQRNDYGQKKTICISSTRSYRKVERERERERRKTDGANQLTDMVSPRSRSTDRAAAAAVMDRVQLLQPPHQLLWRAKVMERAGRGGCDGSSNHRTCNTLYTGASWPPFDAHRGRAGVQSTPPAGPGFVRRPPPVSESVVIFSRNFSR